MILNVDLNPSMDRVYTLDKVSIGESILSKSFTYGAGGHGIVATSLLDIFNEEVFMTGFLGGINGEYFHKHLLDLNLAHEFLQIKEETKTRIKLVDNQGNCTTILEEGPRITREEVGRFYGLYARLIEKSNIICCVGDHQSLSLPNDIYFNLVKLAQENRKKIILDIGNHGLNLGIDAIPYMVIVDQRQLEDILGLKLNFENELIKAGRFMLDKGIKYVAINLYDRGSIILGQDKGYLLDINHHKEIMNHKNSTMAAGFALGFDRNYDMEMVIRLGQAFGMVSSIKEIGKIEMSDIKKVMSQIEIYPINY